MTGPEVPPEFREEGRDYFRRFRLFTLKESYSPSLHFLTPAVIGTALAVAGLGWVGDARWFATIPLLWVFANAVEWHIHRDLLHKRRAGALGQLYDAHTSLHHRIYYESDMGLKEWRELSLVLIPLRGIFGLFVANILVGMVFALWSLDFGRVYAATMIAYVLSYEWLHLAYHLPSESKIGRLGWVRWLGRHHARHHDPKRMGKWNMNVTIPIWDFVRRTIWREPT